MPAPLTNLPARFDLVHDMATGLMTKHGLVEQGWTFGFSRFKRAAAMCYFPKGDRPGKIALSIYLVQYNTLDEVADSVLHEIAHALAGKEAGHGLLWKDWCRKIGATPSRCYEEESLNMPPGDWQATCPNCHFVHQRYRRPREDKSYHCMACGQEKGTLAFSKVSGLVSA